MISSVRGVGRTSLLIAAWRAQEAEQPDPLYIDPVANIFSDSALAEEVGKMNVASSSTRHLINYRTRYFDDCLLMELEKGVQQVVILGAGLDTRSLRLGKVGVRFFEFDCSKVLSFKTEKLKRHGYDSPSLFIKGNYVEDDFLSLLIEAGYDPALETYFIWEGNSMYIPESNIRDLLKSLIRQIRCFRFSFDYLSRKIIGQSTGYEGADHLVNEFATLDAQWITGFDDICPLADAVGLEIIEDKSIIEAIAPSTRRVHLNPQLFKYYSICTLAKK